MKTLLAQLSMVTALMPAAAQAAPAVDAAALYQQHCAACHGAKREGAVGPALSGTTWNKVQPNKASVSQVIAAGIPGTPMPAWKSTLAPAGIAALADYLLRPATTSNAVRTAASAVTSASSAATASSAGATAPASDLATAPAQKLSSNAQKTSTQANTASTQASASGSGAAPAAYPELANFRLPVGFSIAVFADQVDTARSMTVAPSGIVYVGSRKAGKVYALVSSKRNYVIDKVVTVASGLNNPIGVAWFNGALYISEIQRVTRIDDIDTHYDKQAALKVLSTSLPSDKWHGEKVIKVGPDGKLYIPVGAPCNVCNKENEAHSKIYRMNPDGSQLEEYARGIRNSVGFAWHPDNKGMWFTDNGRDLLGDNLPSDKLNYAPAKGMHFGFPYCAGGVLADPEFAAGRRCSEFVAPVAKLGPHVAALGLEFNKGGQFPAQYKHQLFVAEHGSWNRSQKIGYRVNLITLNDNQMVSDTVFIDGFIQNGEVIGRPVDIAFLADGSMLVSDDHKGRIYRVTYTEPKTPAGK